MIMLVVTTQFIWDFWPNPGSCKSTVMAYRIKMIKTVWASIYTYIYMYADIPKVTRPVDTEQPLRDNHDLDKLLFPTFI